MSCARSGRVDYGSPELYFAVTRNICFLIISFVQFNIQNLFKWITQKIVIVVEIESVLILNLRKNILSTYIFTI